MKRKIATITAAVILSILTTVVSVSVVCAATDATPTPTTTATAPPVTLTPANNCSAYSVNSQEYSDCVGKCRKNHKFGSAEFNACFRAATVISATPRDPGVNYCRVFAEGSDSYKKCMFPNSDNCTYGNVPELVEPSDAVKNSRLFMTVEEKVDASGATKVVAKEIMRSLKNPSCPVFNLSKMGDSGFRLQDIRGGYPNSTICRGTQILQINGRDIKTLQDYNDAVNAIPADAISVSISYSNTKCDPRRDNLDDENAYGKIKFVKEGKNPNQRGMYEYEDMYTAFERKNPKDELLASNAWIVFDPEKYSSTSPYWNKAWLGMTLKKEGDKVVIADWNSSIAGNWGMQHKLKAVNRADKMKRYSNSYNMHKGDDNEFRNYDAWDINISEYEAFDITGYRVVQIQDADSSASPITIDNNLVIAQKKLASAEAPLGVVPRNKLLMILKLEKDGKIVVVDIHTANGQTPGKICGQYLDENDKLLPHFKQEFDACVAKSKAETRADQEVMRNIMRGQSEKEALRPIFAPRQ